ncbi:MAG TPA: hypothetical protein VGD71_15320 [Kribbella sp.]
MTTDHKKVRLVLVTGTAMSALLAEDLPAARAEAGVELGELFVDHHSKRLWQYRARPTRPRSPPSRPSGSSQVGEQWDEDDGLELLFERRANLVT